MEADKLQQKVWGICLIAAPLLLAVSTVTLWLGEEATLLYGTLQSYAFWLFIPASLGLTALLREKMPRLAIFGSLLAFFGCMGGINYSTAPIFEYLIKANGASESVITAIAEAIDSGLPLILSLPGIIFPLSLLILGLALLRAGVVPTWVGLSLALGALAFPAGRIPDILPLENLADLLLLVPLAWIGMRYLSQPAPEKITSPLTASQAR